MRCQPPLVWRSWAPSLGVKDSEIGDLGGGSSSSTPRQWLGEASDAGSPPLGGRHVPPTARQSVSSQ
eukprot:scaffold58078_cov65-Phaeocystis_antarctica.AAC.5